MTEILSVSEILARAESVLVDFDGPICSIFSGLPAPEVARRLRDAYDEAHSGASRLAQSDDPLEVVRVAALEGLPNVGELEALLTDLEVTAVDQSAPTPNAQVAIEALHADGHLLAVVSNNSTAALKRYFANHGLDRYASPLVGREAIRLSKMKPAPDMLWLALEAHGVAPREAVLIGDSVTDVQAAQAAGVMSIGYANKSGKAERLHRAGATAVIDDMADLIRRG
ncbi:HAD family hydrolase [Streptomyces sp. NPDC056222]|uniref:HAD family hydrolase n=1 Tax=Streptomyces sp. NPDC056222 TaxID=3345749 RepID=UPI0035D8BBD2